MVDDKRSGRYRGHPRRRPGPLDPSPNSPLPRPHSDAAALHARASGDRPGRSPPRQTPRRHALWPPAPGRRPPRILTSACSPSPAAGSTASNRSPSRTCCHASGWPASRLTRSSWSRPCWSRSGIGKVNTVPRCVGASETPRQTSEPGSVSDDFRQSVAYFRLGKRRLSGASLFPGALSRPGLRKDLAPGSAAEKVDPVDGFCYVEGECGRRP